MTMVSRIAERAAPSTYQAVYDLLEAETFSPLTDAWQKNPDPASITVSELPPAKPADVISKEAKIRLQRVQEHIKMRSTMVELHVGNTSCIVTRDVANRLLSLARYHA
jgi:hypothetical protein